MKDILIATPKEEQFYEVVEFYQGLIKRGYKNYNENSVLHYNSNSNKLTFGSIDYFKKKMPSYAILIFEHWKELVSEPEKVSNELTQDNDLDIQLLDLARKLVIAGRIQDGATLSIIAGNSMKEKSK